MAHGWLRICGVFFGPLLHSMERRILCQNLNSVILDQGALKNLKPKILPFLEQIFDPVSKHNCW